MTLSEPMIRSSSSSSWLSVVTGVSSRPRRLSQRLPPAVAFALVFVTACATGAASAADRALLVGIGDYPQPGAALPGIDIDLDRMETVARELGYTEIRRLADSSATQSAVLEAIQSWLSDVEPSDRALFYFSGHGLQVPSRDNSEADELDEHLLLFDSTFHESYDRGLTLTRTLEDSELGAALRAVPSQNKLVIVDACHSGTVLRSGGAVVGYPKTIPLGLPRGLRSVTRQSGLHQSGADVSTVLFSAAADGELARATEAGSVFTAGIAAAVDALEPDTALTPKLLRDRAQAHIIEALTASSRHTPQLSGQSTLLDAPLRRPRVTGPAIDEPEEGPRPGPENDPPGAGVNQDLEELVERADQRMNIQIVGGPFMVGGYLRVEVDAPFDGFLNVVASNSDGSFAVLYPNGFETINRVSFGALDIPEFAAPWAIRLDPPAGTTTIYAFLSEQPLDISAVSNAPRDLSGKQVRLFAPVGRATLSQLKGAFEVVERDRSGDRGQRVAAGSIRFDVIGTPRGVE